MFILGLNLLPKEDRENKLRILNRDEILLKKSNAGAKATGKKLSLPENIKKNPKIIIKATINMILTALFSSFFIPTIYNKSDNVSNRVSNINYSIR